jgi:hypothetical protein
LGVRKKEFLALKGKTGGGGQELGGRKKEFLALKGKTGVGGQELGGRKKFFLPLNTRNTQKGVFWILFLISLYWFVCR